MLRASTFLAAALASVSASAQTAANTSPSAVDGGTFTVDPNHTQVGFRVLHMGFTFYAGRFSGVSGSLELKPKALAASTVNVTVPMSSVSTTSSKLDDELKGADWFDAARYPTMSFKSTKVAANADGAADVAGNLTIHGVTKPVILHVHFVGSGTNPLDKKYTAGFEISGDIDRSAFGVTKYVPLIGNTVHLSSAPLSSGSDAGLRSILPLHRCNLLLSRPRNGPWDR